MPEWLALAAARGLRPPPELLPDLLDQRRRRSAARRGRGAARAARALAGRARAALGVCARRERRRRRGVGGRRPRGAAGAVRAAAPRGPGRRPASCSRARSPTRPGRTARRSSSARDGLSDADEPFLESALDDSRASRSATRRRRCSRAAGLALRRADGRARAAAAARRGRRARGRRSPARRTRPRSATGSAGGPALERLARCSPPRRSPPGTLDARRAAGRRRPRAGCPRGLGARPRDRQRDADVGARALARHRRPELLGGCRATRPRRSRPPRPTRSPPRCELAGPWGPELSRAVIDAIRRAARRAGTSRVAGYRLDPALEPEAEPLRDLGGRDLWNAVRHARASGLPCCGSWHDRTPPAPRRAALRGRARRARARRRPPAPAAVAALAVGGDHLRARRRGGRHHDHAEVRRPAAAHRARRRHARHRPRAAAARRARAPRRRGCPSTSPRRSAATAR